MEAQRVDLLDPAEMSTVLSRIPAIEKWCKDIKEAALTRLYTLGEEIPGYKVVLSGGRRGIQDETAAIKTLVEAGLSEEDVATRKIKALGELEKALKRSGVSQSLDDVLGPLIRKSEGSPSIVTDTDKREAVNSLSEAAKDFS